MLQTAGPEALKAFHDEARLFAQLNHLDLNLTKLLAVSFAVPPHMAAFELVEGMNLTEYLIYIRANNLEDSLTSADITDVITQVADVMTTLSRFGVVHRDICARLPQHCLAPLSDQLAAM